MYKALKTAILTYMVLVTLHCSCLTPTEYALINDPSAEDVTGIQQTLGLWPVAIDRRQFDLLDAVFVPNATFDTGHSVAVGLPAIKAYVVQGLTGIVSQHDLGTLYVNQTGLDTATSYNYLQGNFFGTGNLTGQTLLNFGYYVDNLVKRDGRWLIQKKVLGNFGTFGNLTVIAGLINA